MSNVDGLSYEQARIALRFLLYRMSMETRRAMMSELPITYAKLYPYVDTDTITSQVVRAINSTRSPGMNTGGE